MDSAAAVRYGRQIALPEIGPDGQERILRAHVVVVGRVTVVDDLPSDGEGWLALLDGVSLVVRSGFDDDALAGAAARRGVPVVVVRAAIGAVDLVSFPERPPAPDAPFAASIPARTPSDAGAAAVLAGVLAAAEAMHALVRGGEAAEAIPSVPIRHLRLPLDGGDPVAQVIGAR
jgi:hypothetical protein